MKHKFLLVVCLLSVVITLAGCRKKSSSQQQAEQQKAQKTELQVKTLPDKSLADKQLPKELMPVVDLEKAVEEEVEYFAVFMKGKKIGYAVHKRVVRESEV